MLTHLATMRARAADPLTSHEAAERAERFAASHAGRIYAALMDGPATAHDIGQKVGLSVEQCCRRTVELQRAGRIAVEQDAQGNDITRDGYRVWRLA